MTTTNTSSSESCLTLTSPTDILAAVPYLVGFHPSASLIVIGLDRGQAKVVARWGLPFPPGTLAPMVPLFEREGVTDVVIIGYGPGDAVTPAVDEARRLAAEAEVHVGEALRAHEGRYWSYVCDLPACCPPEGTPYDPSTTQVAAEATVRGLVALPDREALERTIAPVTGPVRLAMRRATVDAITEVRGDLTAAPNLDAFAQRHITDGLARVRSALTVHAEGDRLGDAEAARLGLDLAIVRVRDEAWTLMHESHAPLWKDLTRRLEPRFVPPAASLLAMSAWRAGNSVQATIALERALAIDPGYSMANLLMHALHNLLSPTILRDRLPTPAELDAAMGAPHAGWLLPLINLSTRTTSTAYPADTAPSHTRPRRRVPNPTMRMRMTPCGRATRSLTPPTRAPRGLGRPGTQLAHTGDADARPPPALPTRAPRGRGRAGTQLAHTGDPATGARADP